MKELTKDEFEKMIEDLHENPLYQKSQALHKEYQFRMFTENGNPMDGQKIRLEDSKGCVEGQPNFDNDSKIIVIYNFKDGFLHSENNNPALQYPGHFEFWDEGMITKVVADGGSHIEQWKDGVPDNIQNIREEEVSKDARKSNRSDISRE